MATIDIENAVIPGLARRFAAMFYDSWLLVGLWFLGATADFVVRSALTGDTPFGHLPLQVFLVACPYLFFGWFWTHGGQTLGMRAWRLVLVDEHGRPVNWRQATLRVTFALLSLLPLGLGYWWALFHPRRLTWHDRFSRTRLVMSERSPR